MAFITLNRATGEALERGFSTAIKASDLRWYDYGADLKKSTKPDNKCIGAVSYVVPDDKANLSGPGTITKMFFDFEGGPADKVMIESVYSTENAVSDASGWVATVTGVTMSSLVTKCPAAG